MRVALLLHHHDSMGGRPASGSSDRICRDHRLCNADEFETKAAGCTTTVDASATVFARQPKWKSLSPGAHHDRDARAHSATRTQNGSGGPVPLPRPHLSTDPYMPQGSVRLSHRRAPRTACAGRARPVNSSSTGNASICRSCIAGQYQPNQGMTRCRNCGRGTSQAASGQIACNACKGPVPAWCWRAQVRGLPKWPIPGENGSDFVYGVRLHGPCRPLPRGPGLTVGGGCKACVVGQFKAIAGPGIMCGVSYRASLRYGGQSFCTKCNAFSYQDETGQEHCKYCEYGCGAGKYTQDVAAGAGACVACHWPIQGCMVARVRGLRSWPLPRRHGLSKCKDCPSGKFQAVQGRAQCESCDESCPAGQFHVGCGGNQRGSCHYCAPGRFKATPGTGTCTDCLSGHFQDSSGSARCKACPRFTFQPLTGNTSCKVCKYDCAGGYYHTTCGASGSGSCEKCPAGQFKWPGRGTSCYNCFPGITYSASMFCNLCPPGTYQDAHGEGKCNSWTVCRYNTRSRTHARV